MNFNKCYCLSSNKKIVNLGKKCLWIMNVSWFLTQHLFPNVWLLLSTENFVQLTIFSPHFLSASEKTDITQVPEVGATLLKANKCNAIYFPMEFGLEKELESINICHWFLSSEICSGAATWSSPKEIVLKIPGYEVPLKSFKIATPEMILPLVWMWSLELLQPFWKHVETCVRRKLETQ